MNKKEWQEEYRQLRFQWNVIDHSDRESVERLIDSTPKDILRLWYADDRLSWRSPGVIREQLAAHNQHPTIVYHPSDY